MILYTQADRFLPSQNMSAGFCNFFSRSEKVYPKLQKPESTHIFLRKYAFCPFIHHSYLFLPGH